MAKSVRVTVESDSGRNQQFRDEKTGQQMSRAQFVQQIRNGERPDYHVRTINNVATPVSNPDRSEGNNLD
jgi:hypothetical protein